MRKSFREGFTLLELSMVLMIIALIIGGILVGTNLSRVGQLQSAMKDAERFQQAILDFRDKYQSLPGDMYNAESFWGTDPGGCPNTASNTVPKTATCNGTGIGTIGGCESGTTCAAPTNSYEWFRAWQHLANAGMIEGSYAGTSWPFGPSQVLAALGTDVPKSAIKGGGYSLRYFKDSAGDANYYAGGYGHIIEFGYLDPGHWPTDVSYPILTPTEAANIDNKMDDGGPASGKVMAQPPSSSNTPNCTTNTAQYNVSYGEYACSLIFVLPF